MGYIRFGKDQDGLVVYDLSKRLSGITHRERIHCHPNDIERVFAEWVEKKRQAFTVQDGMLFDVMNQHLAWCRETKPLHHAEHMERYFKSLKDFLGKDVPIDSMKRADLLKFVDWRRLNPLPGNTRTKKVKLSESTLLRCVGALSGFFNWAKDRELMRIQNPCSGLRIKDDSRGKRDTDLTPEQMQEILSRVTQEHHFTFLLLLMTTGIRAGEALSLEWSHVDIHSRKIHLTAGNTKSKKARSVDLPAVTVNYLERLDRTGLYVVNIAGERVGSLKGFWRRLRQTLSFPEGKSLCLHGFRHNYITWAMRANVDPHSVQKWAGHGDLATTGRYDHYRPGNAEAQKMEVLTDILKGVTPKFELKQGGGKAA